MLDQVDAIYIFIDEFFKFLGYKDDPRCKLNRAEVLTTAIIAVLHFGGNIEKARIFMISTNAMPHMLDKSRFNRRLHKMEEEISLVFFYLGHILKDIASCKEFILDSFPVAVCDNIRIPRSKLVKGEEYRGWKASMRRYFYGIKVHILTTNDGIPVEYTFTPGKDADIQGLQRLPLDLASGSQVYADAGYTDYQLEEHLAQEGIDLQVARKKNSKKLLNQFIEELKKSKRKRIETSISQIKSMFASKIHAVTMKGFLIKILLFLLAFQLQKAYF